MIPRMATFVAKIGRVGGAGPNRIAEAGLSTKPLELGSLAPRSGDYWPPALPMLANLRLIACRLAFWAVLAALVDRLRWSSAIVAATLAASWLDLPLVLPMLLHIINHRAVSVGQFADRPSDRRTISPMPEDHGPVGAAHAVRKDRIRRHADNRTG